jgi:hypothetical protein
MHDMYQAFHRMYSALNVRDIDAILKPQNVQHPKDPAMENSEVLEGAPLKAFAGQQHDAHTVAHLMQGFSPMLQANPAAAIRLQQHILEHMRLKAEEQTEAELFMQYGKDPKDLISALQKEGMIALKIAQYMQDIKGLQSKLQGDQSDPLVSLKEKELGITEASNKADEALEKQKLTMDGQEEQAKIISQEKIAMLRAQPPFRGNPNATQNRQ